MYFSIVGLCKFHNPFKPISIHYDNLTFGALLHRTHEYILFLPVLMSPYSSSQQQLKHSVLHFFTMQLPKCQPKPISSSCSLQTHYSYDQKQQKVPSSEILKASCMQHGTFGFHLYVPVNDHHLHEVLCKFLLQTFCLISIRLHKTLMKFKN